MSDPSTTREVVGRYLDALNDHDPDAVAACVARDFHNDHASSLGNDVRGRDAYRARLGEFLARFTELRYEVEDWIVDGDHAAVPYHMTCMYVDDGAAHPVSLRGIFRFRVADGLVAHRVDYWDGRDFLAQVSGQR